MNTRESWPNDIQAGERGESGWLGFIDKSSLEEGHLDLQVFEPFRGDRVKVLFPDDQIGARAHFTIL